MPQSQFKLSFTGVEDLAVPECGKPAFSRSFLKWAGNKFQILTAICEALPPGTRLVEPFAGSGAVFLNADFDGYWICDANSALMGTFKAVAQNPKLFAREGRKLFVPETNQEARYYELRDEFNKTKDDVRRALLFVYLNRHCFNGLCRFNRKGEFNVPFGRYLHPRFPEEEMLRFAERSQRAAFACQDFVTTMRACQEGDVVYCDPPYVPLSKTASFTAYSTASFSEDHQRTLADEARILARRGIPVVLSNHDTPLTREIYRDARLRFIDVQRFISCDGANRGTAPELIAVFETKCRVR